MTKKIPLKIITHGEFCLTQTPDPCGVVIFGASGDLTHRKIIPALYHLYQNKLLAADFFVLGIARTPKSDESFRSEILKVLADKHKPNIDIDVKLQKEFSQCHYYQSGDYADPLVYQTIKNRLQQIKNNSNQSANIIFYLATPSDLVCEIIQNLAMAQLIQSSDHTPWSHVVIEKPFGHDLESASKLNKAIHQHLSEKQIYKIDHYLGKETVQNILMFRFSNTIFEPLWNRQYIDHIQITAAETLGVEHRAGYYDKAGVLRDMFQNHMLQLLALVAMEPPCRFESDQYRDEKVKLLRAIRPTPLDRLSEFAVRGQYGEGMIDGKKVLSFQDESGVDPHSQTETFAAIKLFIDNWRWEGVPFYLRSGKRLQNFATEIVIQFKNVPHSMFYPMSKEQIAANFLSFRIQPDEGISLAFEAKHPGPKTCMASVNLNFSYQDIFGTKSLPDAYERLLLDCMLNEPILFSRQDMIEFSWGFITPILKAWKDENESLLPLPIYEAGSWGPELAKELIQQDGREWKLS
ncbi:MAG: glucose-6-phosphate dehydrogenase [Oligoflexia bacterium]|nr:glucose-6-phosphate dehydrogenase [Oligoflexia bacterium]